VEKQVRTLHNTVDKGPDPHSQKQALKQSNTATIADYLKDPNKTINNKGAPWIDIVEEAGVELPKTVHFKPLGIHLLSTQSIQ
jgi:hypothetical protein